MPKTASLVVLACLFWAGAALAQLAPVVTGVSPTTGSSAGGTTVTISGSNFLGASAVKFGAVAATSFSVTGPGTITATSPAATPGSTVDITVTTALGTSGTTAADRFTFFAPQAAPVINSITPSSGPPTGGTAVTILGSGFSGASAVNFGASAASSFTVNSDGSISAVSPPGSTGTVDVTVTTVSGTSAKSSADQFTYTVSQVAPSVTSLSPATGPAPGGQAVTITGTNFVAVTSVKFGSLAATSYSLNSPTSITAVTPAQAQGQVNVTVTTSAGTSPTSSASIYTYVPVPPNAPTIGTATARSAKAYVTFTAPSYTGGAPITSYTVTSSPGNITTTGAVSPILVKGLSNGVSYTFTVTATNTAGTGTASAPSNAVTPNPVISANPITGWWWNASQGGRGYAIELSTDGKIFIGAFMYITSGNPTWYVATMSVDQTYGGWSGPLQLYSGGQTLGGTYHPPAGSTSQGTVALDCPTALACELTLPSSPNPITIDLQRYDFVAGGSSRPVANASSMPQNGWWWNSSEGGRGYFLEVQSDSSGNNTAFAAYFMYNSDGTPLWYITTAAPIGPSTGQVCSGGNTINDTTETLPTCSTLANGAMRWGFTSPTAGTLSYDSFGISVPVQRFGF